MNTRDNRPAGLALQLDAEALRPLITEVVRETLAQVEAARAQLDGRLAYSEEEAARLIGLEPHVLRDERRRGRVTASQVVGAPVSDTRKRTCSTTWRRDASVSLTARRAEAG